jgi:Chalcone isomerase-like
MNCTTFFNICLLTVAPSIAMATHIDVEGVRVNESVTVSDEKLVLNGAGYHQRSANKAYVLALYATAKKTTLDELKRQPGAKRIVLQPLKDMTGSTFSKYFMQDFAAVASKAEFTKLINEVASVGALYGTLPKVTPSDALSIDWVPGKGILFSKNGKPVSGGLFEPYLNTADGELLFHIWLRMYAGSSLPQDLQKNLMGLSTSMQQAKDVSARAQ